MSADSYQIVQLLDERIQRMDELAVSLSLAAAAITACDIDSLEERIREQEKLCIAIRDLDARLESLQARRGSTQWDETLRIGMVRLREVQQRVKSLNSVHAELLRRSRRTVRALSRAYQSVSVEIYSNPARQTSQVEGRV